jgi:hypothetical protein
MDGVTAPDAPDHAKAWSSVDWYSLPNQPTGPAPAGRRRPLVTVLAVAWVLVLVGTGTWYSFHGSPTIREQTTIAQAQPRVDEAVGRILVAAGTGPVPAVSGYEKTADCRVTPIRAGARYERFVRLYTPVGDEVALLGRIAGGLPSGYRAELRGDSLFADAGYYVTVTGVVEQPGVVHVVAGTGCRPLGHEPAIDPTGEPPAAVRAAIDRVLHVLGAGTAQWSTHTLPCGVRTVEATAPAGSGSLRTALHPADAVLGSADAVAYRDAGPGAPAGSAGAASPDAPSSAGAASPDAPSSAGAAGTAVAVLRDGGGLTVTATTGSCA